MIELLREKPYGSYTLASKIRVVKINKRKAAKKVDVAVSGPRYTAEVKVQEGPHADTLAFNQLIHRLGFSLPITQA